MSTFNLDTHPLIDADGVSSSLDSDELDEQENTAVELLATRYDEIENVDSSHDQFQTIRRAVVHQVLYQVHRLPEAEVTPELSQGKESLTYAPEPLSTVALRILGRVFDEAYNVPTNFR